MTLTNNRVKLDNVQDTSIAVIGMGYAMHGSFKKVTYNINYNFDYCSPHFVPLR